MRKYVKRILVAMIAMSIMLTDINFPVNASENSTNEDMDVQNYNETDSFDEFKEEVSSLNEEISLNSDRKYSTKRLIVFSDVSDFNTYDAETVLFYDGMYILSYKSEQDCADAYEGLCEDTDINTVEIDEVMEVESTEQNADPTEEIHRMETPLKQHLDSMNADTEIKVAVLDTGIDEELLGLDEVIDTKINLSGSGESDSILDDNGHGTEMAAIIMLNGNEKTKIMPIKIANEEGTSTILSAYLGIKEAIKNDADIINISMNTKTNAMSQILTDVINEASEAGIIVVVSAGNDGINTENITPANIDSAIVVSAIDDKNQFAEYSNYGESVDYCAFGTFENKTGTSYAAANVSGIFANAMSKGLDKAQIDEFTVNLWEEDNQELYGNGLLSYEYSIFGVNEEDTDDEDGSASMNRAKTIVASLTYVALGDKEFDIENDTRDLYYDDSIYTVELVSCEPEFNINQEGDYTTTYKFTDKDSSSYQIASRTLQVINDAEFVKNYELKISEVQHDIKEETGKVPAIDKDEDYSRDKEMYKYDMEQMLRELQDRVKSKTSVHSVLADHTWWPSAEMTDSSVLSVSFATQYVALKAMLGCAKSVKNGAKWSDICNYGEKVYKLEYNTQTGYKDNTEEAGTGDKDSYKRNKITKFAGGNAPECPSKIDGDPNVYGCVIAYEIKKEIGGNVNDIFKSFTVDNIEHTLERLDDLQENTSRNTQTVIDGMEDDFEGNAEKYKKAFNSCDEYNSEFNTDHEVDYKDCCDVFLKVTTVTRARNLFNVTYNSYDDEDKKRPEGVKEKYRPLQGWGGIYGDPLINLEDDKGTELPDARGFKKYGSIEDDEEEVKNEPTYVSSIQEYIDDDEKNKKLFDTLCEIDVFDFHKEGEDSNIDDVFIHLYKNDRIYFKLKAKTCTHSGTLSYVYLAEAHGERINEWSDEFEWEEEYKPMAKRVGDLVIGNSEEDEEDNTICGYTVPKDGYYRFMIRSSVFACKVAKIYTSTETGAEIFTDRYKITYSAVDPYGNSIEYTPPAKANPVSYNKYTEFTLGNPTKDGWVFDGWSEGPNDDVGGTTGKLLGWSKSVKVEKGSYGNRNYIAHFHQPVYTVKHEFEQLDGTFLEKIGERKTFTANTGTVVTPQPLSGNSITGFTAPAPQSITVLADDSATVIYRYTRNPYNATCIDVDAATNAQLGIHSLGLRKYGSTVTGAEAPAANYPNYTYTGRYTQAAVSTNGATVKRYYSNTPVYIVEHYLQKKDKSFQSSPFFVQSATVDIGATVTASPVRAPAVGATDVTAEFPNGYNLPNEKNVSITSAGQVIRMEYTIKEYQVACEDYEQGTNIKLGPSSAALGTYLYGDTASGADFGNDATIDAYYPGYVYTESTSITVNDDAELVVRRYFKKSDNSYIVHHWYEQQDGDFEKGSSDTYKIDNTVPVGSQVTAPLRPKTGYVNPDVKYVTRRADGTANPNEIVYEYRLNTNCPVKYIDRVINTEKQIGDTVTKFKTFGTTVSGAESGEDKTVGAYYPGYAYVSSTTATVKETGTVVYRYFEDKNTTYTVIHRLQRKNTEAEVFDIAPDGWETLSAVVGDVVTPQPRTKYAEDGYIIPEAQTVTVGADGQTVVTYNYYLAEQEAQYTVRHMLQDSDGTYSLYGMPQTFEADFGSIVTPATLDASEIPGYKIPPQQTITVDGTTGVTYYYDLSDDCAVTCIDIAREDGHQLGTPQVANKTYKTTVYGSDWGSDMTVGRYHDGYVYDGCTNAVVELEGTTVYRYFVLSGSVTPDDTYYQVLHKKQQPDGSYVTADPEAFPAKVGETVRPAPRTYIGYRTPPVQEAVVLADGKTIITYLYDLDVQRARYEVHHYKEQPDGSFQEVLEDAGFFTGMAGEMTDADPNNYSGYDIPDKINKVIQADGTTRIDYQYRLKTVTVTFIDRVKYTATNLGSSEEGYRIGTMVSGAMKGTDKTPGAYYDNYVYDSATTATVTADGATVYRYFVLDSTGYKVEHKQQQPDGKYVVAERETFTGKAGTTVTPETKDYSPAYVSPPEQTVTIAEDGSTVVTYLYDTARYNVTFIDKVKDSEDELGRSVSERAYGSTVSGSEKGTDAGPGKYYEGYTYHSFTSATVRENGTAVYRYFVRVFAKYRVNHIWEQEDGERTTVETKQFRAGAGSEVTPAVNSYDGYDSPQPQTVRRGEGGEESSCLFGFRHGPVFFIKNIKVSYCKF